MTRIAVTGGIGSGKSEVLKIAAEAGYATASADEINSGLLSDPGYLRRLEALFPEAVREGRADRKILRDLVFGDARRRMELEALAHPAVAERIAEIGGDPVFVEMPLLPPATRPLFDRVLLVVSPEELRMERILSRGNGETDRETAERIMEAQRGRVPAEADYEVVNDGTREELRTKVLRLLDKIAEELK